MNDKCIVVVEDNPADVELLRWALIEHGLDCPMQVIGDGETALEQVRQWQDTPTQSLPDLVILDLNIPKHDGLEILEKLRSHDRTVRLPVVVLTSSASPAEKMRLLELGISRHIVKPPDLEEFFVIGRILKQILLESRPKWESAPG